ncbi:MAG: PKD domain-containing protein [Bacteroidota bacterium]
MIGLYQNLSSKIGVLKNTYLSREPFIFLCSFLFIFLSLTSEIRAQSFSQALLSFNGNEDLAGGITGMMFGPDGRLYVVSLQGKVNIFTISRSNATTYEVTEVEVLDDIQQIVNHDDDGSPCSGSFGQCFTRETIGIVVSGTQLNPVFYVSSSDIRIGAGEGGGNGDVDLDTNSGIITRFSWTGTDWDVVDIVRGLPRSEENHATNGLDLVTIDGVEYLMVAQGGNTNGGAPSVNFVYSTEYALAAAVLAIDLNAINGMPLKNDNGRNYIYDLPTVDDPTRPNVDAFGAPASEDPSSPDYSPFDVNDPWGGNDGLNQARIVADGPVQVVSPGYRNAYDLVVTESGALYVTDNGANIGWGGFPPNEGTGFVTNDYNPLEPGSQEASGGEFINNEDHLHLVTNDLSSYVFGSYYGGHPNPIRANPSGAGLFVNFGQDASEGVFRTLIYDPSTPGPGFTDDKNLALPVDWPPLPLTMANPDEGDWRGPGIDNPDGPLDGEVTIWGTNTNGIAEYKASNFNGAMKGDLLATHSDGNIRRVQLNAEGGLETLTSSFLSGAVGFILAIDTTGDDQIFPGTVWTGDLSGNIQVFEPQDFIECITPDNPNFEPTADNDFDGYSNQDEIDSGTDFCNGGSQPADFDRLQGGVLLSNFNDPDDDFDGISDVEDPFQLGDPAQEGSDAFVLPISNDFFNFQQGLGGYLGLGLTGFMNNGSGEGNWLNMVDRRDDPNDPNPNDVLGGAPGIVTMHMTSGTALGTTNDQEKGLQYGIQVDQSTGPFEITGGMVGLNGPLRLYGNTAAINGELGFFIGDGTQSNYIKLVLTVDGLTALQEINDIPQPALDFPIAEEDRPNGSILFRFTADPANGLVSLAFQKDNASFETVGSITAQGTILEAIQQSSKDLAVGLIGTSNTPGVELEGSWDFLNVVGSAPTLAKPIPNFERLVGTNPETLDLTTFFSDDEGAENLIYSVVDNSDPAVMVGINGTLLTLTFPENVEANANITIRAKDTNGFNVEQVFTVTVIESAPVLYRVNAGGPEIMAIDGDINWEEDTADNGTSFLDNAGTNSASSGSGINKLDASIDQSTVPVAVFDSERFDNSFGPPNLSYAFPIAQAGNYEIRLYFANAFGGTSKPDQRVFDVAIEGTALPALTNIDLAAQFGHRTGGMISHIVNVDDGILNITLLHGLIENPLLNAIEILEASNTETPLYVFEIPNQVNTVGDALDGSLSVNAIGGDGNLTYTAQNLPPGLFIEPTNGQIGGTISIGAQLNSPYLVTIVIDDNDGLNSDTVTLTFSWDIKDTSNFRINSGGNALASTDIGTDWKANAQDGAQEGEDYSINKGFAIQRTDVSFDKRHSSIPAYLDGETFEQLFSSERIDNTMSPNMEYTIPIDNGSYIVNLYLSDQREASNDIGSRIFNILIEEERVVEGLDLTTAFGNNTPGMLSFPISVNDEVMNIAFEKELDNPTVNAIELFSVDETFPILLTQEIPDQDNSLLEEITLTAAASGGDPDIPVAYYINGQPLGLTIDEATGTISGTIDASAANGGINGNGIYEVVVTAMKTNAAPSSVSFNWTITPIDAWGNLDEDENYTARHENAFVQAGDRFFVIGGRENATTVDVYDYENDKWSALTDSAPFEFNHFQAIEYQGLIWVIGAFKDNSFPAEIPSEYVWMFNPATNVWIQGPEIPVERRRGSTGLVQYDGQFYIIGGNTRGHDGGYVPWLDRFDPQTGTWTVLPDAPRARDHFQAALIDDEIYAVGGRLSGGIGTVFAPVIAEVDIYNITTGEWSTLSSEQNLPTARGGSATSVLDNKIVVMGGEVEAEPVYGVTTTGALAVTEQFDPTTQEWSRLPDMNFRRHGTQAIVSGGGIITTAGSDILGGKPQKNMEFYKAYNPVGAPSIAASLTAPSAILVADDSTQNIELVVAEGNVGVFIQSIELTGPDAADFQIVSETLNNVLLEPDTITTVAITLSTTATDKSAQLVITYNDQQTLAIDLTNDPDAVFTVESPGNQTNSIGDDILLAIDANSTDTLLFEAEGLPPTLSIDGQTGVISGTIANGVLTDDSFQEVDGLVVIEAESNTIPPTWRELDIEGATVIQGGTDHFNDLNGGLIPYSVNITTPGVYRFNWRSLYPGTEPTEENDSWLRFPNDDKVWFFAQQQAGDEASIIANLQGSQDGVLFPIGSSRVTADTTAEGSGLDGFFKIFRTGGSSNTYKWEAVTNDFDIFDIYVWFTIPGRYTFEIAERSEGHSIDKMVLYKVDGPSYSEGQLTVAPQSPITPGISDVVADSPYDVTITVTPQTGIQQEKEVTFQWFVEPADGPVAVAEADTLSGEAPLTVSFTGTNSFNNEGPLTYSWDFGDGTTSQVVNPQHVFEERGTYVVTLTINDVNSKKDTDTITIEVSGENEPPVAAATATPQTGESPLTVMFDGTGSTDDIAVAAYLWDFDDNGSTSTEASPTYVFNEAGIYQVSLTVTDNEGATASILVPISISEPGKRPVAIASATPNSGIPPLTVSFTGSSSIGEEGIASYAWDFDDGTVSSEADPVKVFEQPGTYLVSLTVTDSLGFFDTVTMEINVLVKDNIPPVAVAKANINEGQAPLEVNFDGSDSEDDSEIVSYEWDFDDNGVTKTGATTTHIFANPNTYEVTLTVTDDEGLQAQDTITIIVLERTVAGLDNGELSIIAVPNPAGADNQGNLELFVTNALRQLNNDGIRIFDTTGRLVLQLNPEFVNGAYQIPNDILQTLENGLYTVKIGNEAGDELAVRFLVKH